MRFSASMAIVALLVAGCTGVVESGPTRPAGAPRPIGPRNDGTFACTPGDAPSVTPLRRLSRLQYENTLADLFDGVPGIESLIGSAMSGMPADEAPEYRGMDTRVSERHVQAFYDVADVLAGSAVEDAALAALAGDCATAPTASAGCIDAFLDDFGLRALRRPLTTEERTRYHALNDGTRDGREVFRSLVFSLLMAPQFLYQVEVDGTPAGSELHLALGPYEVASRLSYHFWQTMPDDALFAAAADGSILTDEGYEAQVRRLFDDPRTRVTVATFYDEWLDVGATTLRPGAALDALVDDAGLTGSEDAFLTAAADEIRALTAHYTWTDPSGIQALVRSNVTLTDSPELAGLYGVSPSDGTTPVALPAAERSGLLSRAAFLISGNHTTHPIHRGFFVRHRLLCEELVAPSPTELPAGSLVPPAQDPTVTTRVRYERKVASPQCASCHVRMNPIGYVLEQYDGLGRFRTFETVFDDVTGDVLAMLPVDSRAAPRISLDDATEVSTAAELTELVAESPRLPGCFAMNYFRFAHHREVTAHDGCTLEGVRAALAGGTLEDALFSIAMQPSFRQRTVEETP